MWPQSCTFLKRVWCGLKGNVSTENTFLSFFDVPQNKTATKNETTHTDLHSILYILTPGNRTEEQRFMCHLHVSRMSLVVWIPVSFSYVDRQLCGPELRWLSQSHVRGYTRLSGSVRVPSLSPLSLQQFVIVAILNKYCGLFLSSKPWMYREKLWPKYDLNIKFNK